MRNLLLLLLVALAIGGFVLARTFNAETLPVPADHAILIPAAHPPPAMRISVIRTGEMASSAAFAYRGGSFSDERTFGMDVVLIDHPMGRLLIDAGFGSAVDEHAKTTPLLMRLTSKRTPGTSAAAQLRAAGIDPATLKGVILTHAHWDHVSGLADLPGVPVWATPAERNFVASGDAATELARRLGPLNWKDLEFGDVTYMGFARSLDVFGDGSVVVVPAPGHTPGSVVVFVNPPGDTRYAFVGDTVWQTEAVRLPAQRPWLSRRLVDFDEAGVRSLIVQLHTLTRAVPDLVVVPAHDRRAMDSLPQFVGGR